MKRIRTFCTAAVLMAFLLLTASCNDLVENSNSSDALRYAYANLPGGNSFKAAVPAIIMKCANCHTHAAWYAFGEADYFDAGLIVPNEIASSKIYYRLSNAPEGPGPKNMPQGGSAAFTDAEVDLLVNWINNYNN